MNVQVPFKKNSYTEDKFFVISQPDYEKVTAHTWYLDYDGRGHYRVVRKATKAELSNGYPHLIKLHRFLMGVAKKGQSKVVVDHKNGNTIDNSRTNLRLASHYGNATNTKRNKNSHLWGAAKTKNGKWRAQLTYKGKTVYAGLFKTEQEAHNAAIQKHIALKGVSPTLIKFFGEQDGNP